jgi:hypothetical protein
VVRQVLALWPTHITLHLRLVLTGPQLDTTERVGLDGSAPLPRRLSAVLAPHQDADQYAEDFDSLCSDLGFTVKQKKSYSGTCTEFLGLEIDTAAMEARLPWEKHAKALLLVRTYLRRRSITLLELQSLIGFLSFAAKVVPLGRPFLRRLYNALSCYSASPHRPQPVTPQMKEDVRWWLAFISKKLFWFAKRASQTPKLYGC